MMLSIRMADGIPAKNLSEDQLSVFSRYQTSGHVLLEADRLKLTATGRLIADRIAREALG